MTWSVSEKNLLLPSMFLSNHRAEETDKHLFESVTKDAVDNEVNGAVESDKKVVGLSECIMRRSKML